MVEKEPVTRPPTTGSKCSLSSLTDLPTNSSHTMDIIGNVHLHSDKKQPSDEDAHVADPPLQTASEMDSQTENVSASTGKQNTSPKTNIIQAAESANCNVTRIIRAAESPAQSNTGVNTSTASVSTTTLIKDTQSTSTKPVCIHYKRGKCRYGLVGKECKYRHPKQCKKYMAFGDKDAKHGCIKGAHCPFFHPRLCRNSTKNKECFHPECKFVHLKGTKRQKSEVQATKITTQQGPLEGENIYPKGYTYADAAKFNVPNQAQLNTPQCQGPTPTTPPL